MLTLRGWRGYAGSKFECFFVFRGAADSNRPEQVVKLLGGWATCNVTTHKSPRQIVRAACTRGELQSGRRPVGTSTKTCAALCRAGANVACIPDAVAIQWLPVWWMRIEFSCFRELGDNPFARPLDHSASPLGGNLSGIVVCAWWGYLQRLRWGPSPGCWLATGS